MALIYTYELPSVKGFVHEALLNVYFKTEGGYQDTERYVRGKVDPFDFDRLAPNRIPLTHEEEQYGQTYLVILMAASTIDRAPMPK